MRFFTTVAALALAASVSAQNSTTTHATSSTTTSVSPETTCLAKCAAADICCQAACVNVPCPSQLQANATTECAAQCPQGNGSYVDTQKYASCQSSCISSYFLSTSTGAAAAATGSNGAYTFGSSGSSTTGSGSHATATASASGTRSGSATAASSTGNAAPETRAAIAGAGLFGLIIAGLML